MLEILDMIFRHAYGGLLKILLFFANRSLHLQLTLLGLAISLVQTLSFFIRRFSIKDVDGGNP